jgi:hypothetical protein
MITINYVWLGNGPLGALERFNIFTWKLAGCRVVLYTFHWTPEVAHDHSSLGLLPSDGVDVYDLHALLSADGAVDTPGDPRPLSRNMREVLLTWYRHVWAYGLAVAPDSMRDQIFNLVDLTKSYLAATRRGIVLDLKVGPSPHLRDYASAFANKFISFERGTLMERGLPENQCIGTTEAASTLRCLYAAHYDGKVELDASTLVAQPTTKFCDFFAVTHANFFAFKHRRHTLNVTTQAPDGSAMDGRYEVYEFDGAENHGPFRVFKKTSDQTSQSCGERTTPAQIEALARYVWTVEVPNYSARSGRSRERAEEALLALSQQ